MNAKTIRERFERETGDRLTMHRIDTRGLTKFETLDAGKLEKTYGRFTIGVFPDAARARRERLLREPTEPDEQGVGWEQSNDGWIATMRERLAASGDLTAGMWRRKRTLRPLFRKLGLDPPG